MLCAIKKKLKVCRGSRGVTTFILNPSTTSPPGWFIPGKRAHGTHKIVGGMGQEANHGLSIPYPSMTLQILCEVQKKWNGLNTDLASCHATELCIATVMFWCFFCCTPSSSTRNMEGAVFIETLAAVYQNMLYHFSKYDSVLELFLHLLNISMMLCWTLYRLQFTLHICKCAVWAKLWVFER